LVNIIFLPTATWGHAYFLFYLIPFFAFANALFLVKIFSRHKIFFFLPYEYYPDKRTRAVSESDAGKKTALEIWCGGNSFNKT